MDNGQKFPWRRQVSGTANAVLADAKFPRGSFAYIITEYPIFIGLGISTLKMVIYTETMPAALATCTSEKSPMVSSRVDISPPLKQYVRIALQTL